MVGTTSGGTSQGRMVAWAKPKRFRIQPGPSVPQHAQAQAGAAGFFTNTPTTTIAIRRKSSAMGLARCSRISLRRAQASTTSPRMTVPVHDDTLTLNLKTVSLTRSVLLTIFWPYCLLANATRALTSPMSNSAESTSLCTLTHTGDGDGGDDHRWHIARQNGGVGQTETIQDQTTAQCSAACSSTSWCSGFLLKHTDDHNCDSEEEFCNGACTLLENLITTGTGVDYVASYDCSGS